MYTGPMYLCHTEHILFPSSSSVLTSHHLLTAMIHREISRSWASPSDSVHLPVFWIDLYCKCDPGLPVVAQGCAPLFPVQHLLRWNPTLFTFSSSSFYLYKNSFILLLENKLSVKSGKRWENYTGKRRGKEIRNGVLMLPLLMHWSWSLSVICNI